MPFTCRPESFLHRIPHAEGAPTCVHFDDLFGTVSSGSATKNPLTGSIFFLDYSDNPEPAPKYEFDETGVVLRGTLNLQDEAGKTAVLTKGDTFFIHRGSTVTFSTPKYALAFKASARWSHPSRL